MANRYPEWVPNSLSAAALDLDPDSPEFIAACLAVINGSANSISDAGVRPASDEATAGVDSDLRSEPDMTVISEGLIRQAETEIERLRAELSSAQERLSATTQTVHEHNEARENLARALHTRSGQVSKVKALRKKPAAHDESETLQQLVSAILSDRVADNAALRESRRREDGVRAELRALESDLADKATNHDHTTRALDTAIQGEAAARAELAAALNAITKHESAIVRLRQVIAERDQEISDLHGRALQSERTRAADAAALRTSIERDHESTLEHLRHDIAERDQEISDLQEHLLRSEQTRAADAAALLSALGEYKA